MKRDITFHVWEVSPMDYPRIRRLRNSTFGFKASIFQWRHLKWKHYSLDDNGNPIKKGIPFKQIDTYQKFAKFLLHYYDIDNKQTIYYAIKFYDKFKMNKHYSSIFKCTKPNCKYFQNERCTRWINYTIGKSCLRNPKTTLKNTRWHIYFIIKIIKKDFGNFNYELIDTITEPNTGQIYKYNNYMYRFDWWFKDAYR